MDWKRYKPESSDENGGQGFHLNKTGYEESNHRYEEPAQPCSHSHSSEPLVVFLLKICLQPKKVFAP